MGTRVCLGPARIMLCELLPNGERNVGSTSICSSFILADCQGGAGLIRGTDSGRVDEMTGSGRLPQFRGPWDLKVESKPI